MRKRVVCKDEIIQKGLELIADEGIDSCSIRRLSKELDIGVGTIYNYFASINEFMIEAFEVSWRQTFEKIEALSHQSSDDVTKVIQAIDITLLDVNKRNNLGTKLFLMNSNTENPQFDSITKRFKELISSLISDQDKGIRRETLVDWIVFLLLSRVKEKETFGEGDRLLLKELLEK